MNIYLRTIIGISAMLIASCTGEQKKLSGDRPQRGISDSAEALGFDKNGLNAIIAHYDQAVEEGRLPGAVILIARKGEIVFETAIGYADRENETPMTTDHLFRIYSMSKPIAAAAAFQQVERGTLTLDMAIDSLAPEFADMSVGVTNDAGALNIEPAQTLITVRHLLTHTAGFTAAWSGTEIGNLYARNGVYETVPYRLDDRSMLPANLTEFAERLRKLPLAHEPGAQMTYGLSSDVLGLVVERASEQSFDDYLAENIFKPLGMEDTSFCVSAENKDRLTVLYEYDNEAVLQVADRPENSVRSCPVGVFSGGSGLVSTARDYWRFAEALRQGGTLSGARILTPESAALFEELQPFVDESKLGWWMGGTEWGLSVAQVTDPSATDWKDVAGNYYWSGGASTYFWIDPKNEMVAIMLTQVERNGQPNHFKWDFRDLVYDAFTGAPFPGE